MPLPTGSWAINGNGFPGVLKIGSIDPSGNLKGAVYGQPIFGFWDDVARKITFVRFTPNGDPSTFQIYTGFLIPQPLVLTGFFEAFAGTGATARRVLYGWLARFGPGPAAARRGRPELRGRPARPPARPGRPGRRR